MNDPTSSYEMPGTFADILHHVTRLTRSPDSGGTLVIQVVDDEAFVQFSGGANGVEMDFPMIAPEQRAREGALRAFIEGRGFPVRRTQGEDHAEFLDVDLPADPQCIAQFAHDVLIGVMAANPAAQLSFIGESVGPFTP